MANINNVPSHAYSTEELHAAVATTLAAKTSVAERAITMAVLALIHHDGDLSARELMDQFCRAVPAKKTARDFDEIKLERNRASQTFNLAGRIYRDENLCAYMTKLLNRANDRTVEGDVATIGRYLWKSNNPSAKFKNEYQCALHFRGERTERPEDKVIESLVNAFVKGLKIKAPGGISEAHATMLNNAIAAAVARRVVGDANGLTVVAGTDTAEPAARTGTNG